VNILAIDSATEACSAALLRADGVVFSEFEVAPRQHARLLPEMIRRILIDGAVDRSDLSYCAFANGPGAFTGIRIATAQAQGIGIGLGIPLVPISTLAVLAQAGFDQHPWNSTLAALDARMQEIYWGSYRRDENGCAQLLGVEQLGTEDQLFAEVSVESGVGHGWLEGLRNRVDLPLDVELLPNACSLLTLAQYAIDQQQVCQASEISINYLRNRVAEKARA
jgi:tRNA threonylcarbamoyladenosine biosynthesis protein TsaB